MNFHRLSTRPARYGFIRAVRDDLPGYIAGMLAGPILLVGTALATLIGAPAP